MEIALSQTNRRPKQSGTEWHARKLRLMTHDDSGKNVKALVNEKLHALLYISPFCGHIKQTWNSSELYFQA